MPIDIESTQQDITEAIQHDIPHETICRALGITFEQLSDWCNAVGEGMTQAQRRAFNRMMRAEKIEPWYQPKDEE